MRPPPTSAKRIRSRLTVLAGWAEPEERSVPLRTSPNGAVLRPLGPGPNGPRRARRFDRRTDPPRVTRRRETAHEPAHEPGSRTGARAVPVGDLDDRLEPTF